MDSKRASARQMLQLAFWCPIKTLVFLRSFTFWWAMFGLREIFSPFKELTRLEWPCSSFRSFLTDNRLSEMLCSRSLLLRLSVVYPARHWCDTRAGCDHHFFDNAMATDPFLSFATLIPDLTSKISNSEKIDRTGHFKFWNYNGGPKNQNKRIVPKNGYIGCKWREDFESALRI